jgi:hypothetical protein
MPKLFMLLIGCTPKGRNIEQHDIFFSIGDNIRDLIPDVLAFWPEADNKIHFDAWREVTNVNGFSVSVVEGAGTKNETQLFFINLGGYKPQEFEEFHYKMIVAAADKGEAIRQSKETAFFRHTGFKSANAHVDDKYGVDVDDIFEIKDILPAAIKKQYSLQVAPAAPGLPEDEFHLGYFKLESVDKWAAGL